MKYLVFLKGNKSKRCFIVYIRTGDVFENKGNCSWPKGKTSFTCLPEFSSLLCQECILEDDVMPGEQIEIYLEFLKNEKQSLKKKYFTSLNLNICQERFETIFLLHFNCIHWRVHSIALLSISIFLFVIACFAYSLNMETVVHKKQ